MSISELTFLVLTALADQPRHGYGILREIDTITEGEVKPRVATLYRTVDRMADEGLVEEHATEVVDGRFRRSYRLTETGRAALRAEAARRASTARLAQARLRRPAPGVDLAGGLT